MRIKFNTAYGDRDQGYKQGQEYDFIDTAKAMYFVDRGIAVPAGHKAPDPDPRPADAPKVPPTPAPPPRKPKG